MCSVSVVLPFMNAALDPDAFMEKWYAKLMCDIFSVNSERTLLMLLALTLVAVYILKNVYLLFEYSIQYRFVYGNMLLMQRKMLASYLRKPYEYFLKVDSGEVLRIINDDIIQAFALLMTIISFLTESIVSIMLVVAIFVIAPFVTICMATALMIIMLLITIVIRPIQRRAGQERQRGLAEINKMLIQSIQGIKEIKVTHSEEFFKRIYAKSGNTYARSIRKNRMMTEVPRFMIEAISMSSMFMVIAIMIYRGGDLNAIIPVISAIAAAAIRLLPATNRISSSMGNIVFLEPTLDKVIENMEDIDEESPKADRNSETSDGSIINSLNERILLESITYSYPGTEKNVLSNASMSIEKGQSVGIVGASGAGKTTTVDLILGLLQLNSGRILVDGHDIFDDLSGWYGIIGYIPQTIFLMDDTIKANIAFGFDEKDIDSDRLQKVLKESSLTEFVSDLSEGVETVIGEGGIRLAGGQRQRIGIARALYREPQVLIFDEATSSLDNGTEAAIMEAINMLHGLKTMIIIAHRLTTIEKCDCVFRVEGQKIIRER